MPVLTPMQKRFCEEYIIDCNGSAAAVRAGYSPKTSKEQACDLLTRPHIQAEVERLKAEQSERTKVTADRVVNRLAQIAFADPTQIKKLKYSEQVSALKILAEHLGILKHRDESADNRMTQWILDQLNNAGRTTPPTEQ